LPIPRMSLPAHVERVIRKLFLPRHAGLAWSRIAAAFAKTLIEPTRNITVISSYPALGTHLAALQLARDDRVRWVADFRDPFPRYFPRLVGRTQDALEHSLERWIIRRADAVIVNTESIASRWRKQYPWAQHKIHLIWNGFDPEDELQPLPVPASSHKSIVHTGTLYAGRNANGVLEALARLRSRSAVEAANVRIVLVGAVSPDSGINEPLYERAVSEGWLEFRRSPIPKAQAARLIQEADGLLLLQPQNAVLVPGKLFEYASIGRPILSLAPMNSSIEWILQHSGLPCVCMHPEDPTEVADQKLSSFLQLPNAPVHANQWFREHFDGRRQTAQLAGIIEGIQERH